MKPKAVESKTISKNIETNREVMRTVFLDCSDVIFRSLHDSKGTTCLIVYVEGIVHKEDLSEHVLWPIVQQRLSKQQIDEINPNTISIAQLNEATEYSQIVEAIMEGNAVLFIEGHHQAIILEVKGGVRRGVMEPETEAVIRGSREGFNENLRVNTSLVRFRLKTPHLKMVTYTLGEITKTKVVLSYIDGLADPQVIAEVKKRISSIQIDGVLESGYVEELIEDSPFSPFPQLQYTERPDTISAQLLEGAFAIFVDGTPFVITGPVVFAQFLQASEDYYERFMLGTLIRWLRYIFLFFALFLPAIYISIITYHQDMLPTSLMLSIAAARESIPFPGLIEALIMEVAFEALREAGIRLPKTVGQAVSILGALVIGQAAVEAGIVSAPMVIIVAVTGIASFTIPRFNMAISIRMLRFPLMILAGLFGLFGIILGTMWISVHLCHLRSFGVPYLSGAAPYMKHESKDIFYRAPWWRMIHRPRSISRLNQQRMNAHMMPSPHSKEDI